ncbi:hypothetical protein [Roseateles amylovorans]|uniref:Uncharacterized protein n=1 Tax=Roseateles amylovorans TaxID=2978473 RepID=A0ABY6B1Z7_9BURK|nr:hypothetical protein [Roseateles amylovorans]UXH79208.1 hypothetical protein N4261_04535 [Roseateles amylovorans]
MPDRTPVDAAAEDPPAGAAGAAGALAWAFFNSLEKSPAGGAEGAVRAEVLAGTAAAPWADLEAAWTCMAKLSFKGVNGFFANLSLDKAR